MPDENINKINSIFEELKGKIKPDRSLMTQIAGEMYDNVIQNFEEEGKSVPGRWPALSVRYALQKSKDKSAVQKMLQKRGQLFQSIQQRSTDTEAAVGTNKIYAGVHQFGAEIHHSARSEIFQRLRKTRGQGEGRFKRGTIEGGRGFTFRPFLTKIKARPFLVLTDKYSNAIVEIIKNRIA